nr:CYTH domain-containing protein [Lysinibacillus timonensis]
MAQEIEIEFKNMLTKEQYEHLLTSFAIENNRIVRQTNYYFDTPRWHLKHLHSGLRIRETNAKIECTLKEKTAQNTHLETTDILNKQQAIDMLNGNNFEAPLVKEKLQQLLVPIQDLKMFGSLTTDRIEIPYEGGILVFDHSFYLNCDDYEVEYETNDEKSGAIIFNKFLTSYNIKRIKTEKKIARFMQALNEKKG